MRNDDKVYIIRTYALIWNEDRYYLIGYTEKRHDLSAFRVDCMVIPEMLIKDAVKNTEFNPADYANEVTHMFAGPEQTVTLHCENDAMRSMIDKFGDNVHVEIIDDKHCTVFLASAFCRKMQNIL